MGDTINTRGHVLRLSDVTHDGRRLWAVEPGTCNHAAKPAAHRPFLHTRAECAEYLRDAGASAICWAVVSYHPEGVDGWRVHARAMTRAAAERRLREIKRALPRDAYLLGLQVRHADDLDVHARREIAGL